jgi:hypothetical protein
LAAVAFARALIPAGYMPGGAESDVLFVLCPEGVPSEFMHLPADSGHDDAHAHQMSHDHDDHQCPIGHMLTSATAVDDAWTESPELRDAIPATLRLHSHVNAHRGAYRSRGPPT